MCVYIYGIVTFVISSGVTDFQMLAYWFGHPNYVPNRKKN